MLRRRLQSRSSKPATAGTFASLRIRDFRYLLASTTSLQFGQWFQMIGMGWLAYVVTEDPLQMGIVAAFRGFALIAVSVPGGLLADRVDRRTLVLWATAVSAAQATFLAVLVISGAVQWWHLWVFAAVEGSAAGVNLPAQQALVYDKVGPKTLENAVALTAITMNLGRVTGPTIAGVVIAWLGVGACFLTLAVLNLLALALVSRIRPALERPAAGDRGHGLVSLLQGLVVIRHSRVLLGLLLIHVLPTLLVYPYLYFVPMYTSEVLGFGKDATAYGLLMSAVGFGSLAGAALLAVMGSGQRGGRLMLSGVFGYIMMVMLFSQSTWLPLSFGFLVFAGLFNVYNLTINQTLYQLYTPNETRGRVLSVYGISGMGLQPVGNLIMGVVIGFWGFPNTLLVFALAASLTLVLFIVIIPEMWRLRAPTAEPQGGV